MSPTAEPPRCTCSPRCTCDSTVLNIGFVATRISGTDGVSLEIGKWTAVLEKLGHRCFFIAGESDRDAGASALVETVIETGLPCIAHHHDFVWERDRFLINAVPDSLQLAFPPHVSEIDHVVINSVAGREFSRRTGLPFRVIPNVMDFDTPSAPALAGRSRLSRGDRSDSRRRAHSPADARRQAQGDRALRGARAQARRPPLQARHHAPIGR